MYYNNKKNRATKQKKLRIATKQSRIDAKQCRISRRIYAVLTFASKVQTKKSWLFREVLLKQREGGVAGKLTQMALFSFPIDCLQGGVAIRSQTVPHYECNVRQNHLMLRLKNTMFPNCFTNSYWQKSATNVR